MDYIVPHIQFGKTLDLLSAVLGFLSALFLLLSEDIGLGDQHKFDQGVFKTAFCMTVGSHDLSGGYGPVHVLRVKTAESFLLKVLGQPLCPCPGAGQEKYLVSVFLPVLQIFYQQLEAVVIGIHGLCDCAVLPVDLPVRFLLFHSAEGHTVFPVQTVNNLLTAAQKVGLSCQEISLFQTVLHAFPEFSLHSLPFFQKTVCLIQKYQGAVLIKIIQKGHRFFIKIPDEVFCGRKIFKLLHGIYSFLHRIFQPACLLCEKCLPQLFHRSILFLLYGL